jgi:type I restriction enzyme M protein
LTQQTEKPDWNKRVEDVVREFAKLDGYDVLLRSPEVHKQADPLPASKSWAAPVRAYAPDDEWTDAVEDRAATVQGSHDAAGNVRPEYLAWLRTDRQVYAPDGSIKPEFLHLLDPECIEYRDFNLSARRYRPPVSNAAQYAAPGIIIRELQNLERQIGEGLAELAQLLEQQP